MACAETNAEMRLRPVPAAGTWGVREIRAARTHGTRMKSSVVLALLALLAFPIRPKPIPAIEPAPDTTARLTVYLLKSTNDTSRAWRISRAILAEAEKTKISPALLTGVMLVEDDELKPRARSSVGARGLFQVMPFHAGKWGCGSKDLWDIESNICHGAAILAEAIEETGNTHRALQRYNGCVKGRNTKDCRRYSSKVLKQAALAEAFL